MRATLGILAVGACLLASGCGGSQDPITIGVLADCEGILAPFYESTLAGAELPILERGGTIAGTKPSDGVAGLRIGGHDVKLVVGCAGEPTKAAIEARRLVELEGADVLLGADYTPNGTVLVEYSHRQEGTTFVITSDEQESWQDPGPNVFRFGLDLAQQSAGLGAYAYDRLGWRNAMVLSGADLVTWAQRAGVVTEFCSLGGRIVDTAWLDTLQENVPARVAAVSTAAVDGFILTTDATSGGVFLTKYAERNPRLAQKVIAIGPLFGLERTVAATLGDRLLGMVTASDEDPTTESYRAYAARYKAAFAELAPVADSFEHYIDSRYRNGMEAVLRALAKTDGDLSDGQQRFRAALAGIELDAPQGHITLDGNRQAIGPVYLRQVVRNDGGVLTFRTIRTIENVDASFGGHFGPGDPRPDRTRPPCKRGNPPAWATP